MAGGTITLVVPGHFLNQDLERTVIQELQAGSDELGAMELYSISARTPVDTGALLSDEFYEVGSLPVLVTLGMHTENQLDEWGRVYAPYQEGGELGLATYTNGPHEMFARVLPDDIPQISDWGIRQCQAAMDRCAAGLGFPNASAGGMP
jgi:hypothetical protein